MSISVYDGEFCWHCSTPTSCCNCEFSDSSWSESTSQGSFCTFDGHKGQGKFDVDEPRFCMIERHYFLADPFENPDFETDDMVQCPERGSQQPFMASTPKNNNDNEKWELPGTLPPPESSSPIWTDLAVPISCHEGPSPVHRPFDSGQWRIKALFNDRADLNDPVFPTTPMGRFPQLESDSSVPDTAAQGSPDEHLRAIRKHQAVADAHDICAATERTAIGPTNDLEKPDETSHVSARRRLVPTRKRAILSGPTILDLAISTELEPPSSHGTENDKSCDATITNSVTRDGGVPSKVPSRKVSMILVSCPAQVAMDNRLKRRRSSVDGPLESKKVKLDRTVSHDSCASDASVQSKYQATEPASLRRAQSLKSELSACAEGLTDSLFTPSPLSSLNDCPPTVPSTPLPNSVDYARSKADPLARTLAVYRRRSLEVPAIPPVPIIAPPPHPVPTIVRCVEDQAIDRLKAFLLRERSERQRDGLSVHDEKRVELWKTICGRDPSFSRRDSTSTTDSRDGCSQLEEETTCSATESQESQEATPCVNPEVFFAEHRLAHRETWSNVFGIANDFRKKVTRWILEKLPKEPLPSEIRPRDKRICRKDLYDQLVNSYQTRFHAAQLFHRYFLLPEKAKHWKEAYEYERLEQEWCGSHDDSSYERCIWDLALACVALSVKLHRDCLWPLGPVFAGEFLDLAPYSMTHETFELTQRDVLYTLQFQLGTCTPQDVLDELWNALPTLRRAAASIGWTAVQRVTWDKLFESLLEPDMLQYPVSLLTAAALIEGLSFALMCQYKTESEANVCKCKTIAKTPSSELLDDIEPTTWQIHLFDANQLVNDVISDIKDVFHLSDMELDECRMWLCYVGQA